jgi:hypothetical protein
MLARRKKKMEDAIEKKPNHHPKENKGCATTRQVESME